MVKEEKRFHVRIISYKQKKWHIRKPGPGTRDSKWDPGPGTHAFRVGPSTRDPGSHTCRVGPRNGTQDPTYIGRDAGIKVPCI